MYLLLHIIYLIKAIKITGKAVLTTTNNGKVIRQLELENHLETVAFAPELGLIAFGKYYFILC